MRKLAAGLGFLTLVLVSSAARSFIVAGRDVAGAVVGAFRPDVLLGLAFVGVCAVSCAAYSRRS